MTCITIARPQIMCSGLGRVERIRVPSPAARTIAETRHAELTAFVDRWEVRWTSGSSLRGEESNPYSLNQNQVSYRLNDPGRSRSHRIAARSSASTGSLPGDSHGERRVSEGAIVLWVR